MTFPIALRAARTACAAIGLLLTVGCGGGAGTAEAASPSSSAQAAAVARAAPSAPSAPSAPLSAAVKPQPDELATNGNFTLGLSHWGTQDAVLAASSTKQSSTQVLNVGGSATQPLAAGQVVAGRSYTLLVTARLESPGAPARVGVQFRRPAGAEVIRTYETSVAATNARTYRVDFTAPPYAAMGEIRLAASGPRLLVDSVSLRPRDLIVQTEQRMSLWDSHVPWGYVLEFNDEFNGTELNRSKWFTRYIHAGGTLDRLNDEQQRYRDNDNHRVANGVLSLVARKVTQHDPQGINYESGMIRSDWTARYGYFEARVRMPRGIGMWPAFWLISDVSAEGALGWPPEIDIFEYVNNGVEDRANMLHAGVIPLPGVAAPYTYVDPDFNTQWNFYTAPYNFHDGWHTVGAEWTPTSVTVYLDGKKLFTRSYQWNFPDGSAAGPAHILLNLAVGGSWAGRHGIDDTAFPQALQIDWVRAYSKPR